MEKSKNAKEYIIEHKKEIAFTAIASITIGVLGYKHYNNIVKFKDIAKRSLTRELERNNIEIKKLEKSIEKLKPSSININYRIPERIKRIEELKMYNKEILKDMSEL